MRQEIDILQGRAPAGLRQANKIALFQFKCNDNRIANCKMLLKYTSEGSCSPSRPGRAATCAHCTLLIQPLVDQGAGSSRDARRR